MQFKAPPQTEELETEAVMFFHGNDTACRTLLYTADPLRKLEHMLCLQAERLVRLEAEQRCVEAVLRVSTALFYVSHPESHLGKCSQVLQPCTGAVRHDCTSKHRLSHSQKGRASASHCPAGVPDSLVHRESHSEEITRKDADRSESSGSLWISTHILGR